MNYIELWSPVPGFGGHYEASSMGRVRAIDRFVTKRNRHNGAEMRQFYPGRLLACTKRGRDGSLAVRIGVDGKKINLSVHRAVLLAFVGEPKAGQEACHNNGIAHDNRLTNLRWDSHLENNRDRLRHGTYRTGQDHHFSKYTDEQRAEFSRLSYAEASSRFGVSQSYYYRINGSAHE